MRKGNEEFRIKIEKAQVSGNSNAKLLRKAKLMSELMTVVAFQISNYPVCVHIYILKNM